LNAVVAAVILIVSAQVLGGAWEVAVELAGKDPRDPHYARAVELVNEALEAAEEGDEDLALALLDQARLEAGLASPALPAWTVAASGIVLVGFVYYALPRLWALAWLWARRGWLARIRGGRG